jgi:hypothetical protein
MPLRFGVMMSLAYLLEGFRLFLLRLPAFSEGFGVAFGCMAISKCNGSWDRCRRYPDPKCHGDGPTLRGVGDIFSVIRTIDR